MRPASVLVLATLAPVLLAPTGPGSTPSAPDQARVPGSVAAVAGPVAPRAALPTPTARRSRQAIDTSSRDAVRQAYRRQLLPALVTEPAVTPSGCDVPATPAATQRRTIAAVNFARRMAGLDPVALDQGLSRRAQRAALIQHYLGFLTHTPLSSAVCYSETGGVASGLSNLALGYSGAQTVLAYLADRGPTNRAAGHRRWLLAPSTEAMGTGQVGAANALFVVPPARLRSDSNPSPAWIAWPSAGWFPTEVLPGRRWSFGTARAGVDVRRATVRVTTGGERVRIRRFGSHPGYGEQSAIVFDLVDRVVVPKDGMRAVTVTVRGMTLKGKRLPAVRYTVRLFSAGR